MNKKQIEQALRDYCWMINEIKRQRKFLEDAGTNLVAQSGIESAMPKAKGEPGDPVAREVVRRDKKHTWITKLERKVLFIQERMEAIDSEREKAVLECLLDGMSMSAIGHHMGLSRRHIYTIKESIVEKISQDTQNSLFTHFSQEMTKEKCYM
ncbi:regulatory protein, luxR family [Thalassobacillus cyri]|uniref:Regulatory protein, luxR family n=1 Tax=Thalassobacillus cyri TaxID=571932 RepID=A0A1H4BZI7_9BACI|nr:LuxR C-terminal-related transcriptional regulator [Thalassobacillus cyri]SEA53480.1 regulatory protein, luxR family [Thalassobacillus cyri]